MAISLVGREYLNFWGNNATIVKNCKGFCDFQPIFLLNHSKSMTEFATKLVESLQPISDQFKSLNIPEPVTHWGHPFFMGIVIVAMGSFVAISGWRSRTTTDPEVATKNKADHRKVAPLMTVFLATGYTGGLLSLVMQGKPLLESPHFITGSVVLTLLAINWVLCPNKNGDSYTAQNDISTCANKLRKPVKLCSAGAQLYGFSFAINYT